MSYLWNLNVSSVLIFKLCKETYGGWVQGVGAPPPPLSREARKLWRFIKLLEKEDDSLDRSRLLILVWIQFPPPPPARSAEALTFHLIIRERRRFVLPFSTLNPFSSNVLFLSFFFGGGATAPTPPWLRNNLENCIKKVTPVIGFMNKMCKSYLLPV